MNDTGKEVDLSSIDHLDFKEPCTVDGMHETGLAPPAAYRATGKDPMPCGCRPEWPEVLVCQPCWDKFTHPMAWMLCPTCGTAMRWLFTLERWVRL